MRKNRTNQFLARLTSAHNSMKQVFHGIEANGPLTDDQEYKLTEIAILIGKIRAKDYLMQPKRSA